MSDTAHRAIAIVGVGAVLPDAPNAPAYWQNIKNKRYSIVEVPPERWDPADYYDPDPSAPDKSYSKIGGWVRGFEFDWKRFRIPPRVAAAMDEGQQWAVTIAAEALADYGYPDRPLDTERTGVILGTAMGGEQHYITTLRVLFPEFLHALEGVTEFAQLPESVRAAILSQVEGRFKSVLPEVTEDTMPGELPNIVSGRVANVLNLRGPNFITDAACASSFAAINAAMELLIERRVDAVISGGVDRNMGASIFVKFCKIGALSATGSRPFGDGADGFVMGEGSAAFLLKRLADAERDGDKIYAVIRGVGGSSDGKGKGITAPNPIGQILATRRAWENARIDPATATMVEAHGTSTKVGDVVEVESLAKVFSGAPLGSIAIGSAKSNIGHLKAGAGAAGLLKAVYAVHDKVLPPTLHAEKPNSNIDFLQTPFTVNHELREWHQRDGLPRRTGVSAYGFGGTNFHVVVEEHVPGMLRTEGRLYGGVQVDEETSRQVERETSRQVGNGTGGNGAPGLVSLSTSDLSTSKTPVRGILALGAESPVALKNALDDAWRKVEGGWAPPVASPDQADLNARERLVIDFGDQPELLEKLAKARKAAGFDNPAAWKALTAQGVFRGSSAANGKTNGKIAFLFPGQGSQYTNMGRELAGLEPVVAETFAEADAVMTPILGRPLTSYIFVDSDDPAAMKQAERDLMQTAITQPAMLTVDTALYKLLGQYGFAPDMVMGHSLGEYGALIAAGIMPFADALEASAARGAEMTKVSMADNGWMAAVMAPYDVIMQTLAEVDGYAVAANINSYNQCVVGGESKAVEQAIALFTQKGYQAVRIPVSHAFHTKIVAPASKPLRKVLDRLRIAEPTLPLVANVTGELYPTTVEGIKDILELQIASPVQWVKGLETLYANGCRTFVEVGPKKALKGFVDDVLGKQPDVVSLFTNHPKQGELPTFNQALCGLYAAGYGARAAQPVEIAGSNVQVARDTVSSAPAAPAPTANSSAYQSTPNPAKEPEMMQPSLPTEALGQLAQVLQQLSANQPTAAPAPYDRNETPLGSVVISGTGLGLPGQEKSVMDPDNALRILRGEQFIDLIPERFRRRMLDKQITRLVKAEDGSGSFQVITNPDEVIKLAGRGGSFDLTEEYGVPAKLVEALDTTTQLAFAAGIDALREAGIPLVQTWRKTTTGRMLPDRWMLPNAMRDETGVIFASAFPGGARFAEEMSRFYEWEGRRAQLAALEDLRRYTTDPGTLQEIGRRIADLRELLERESYEFDRRFIFRILAMGHSQFAEYIGARGPNTHVNAACASTAQGVAIAEDWIRSGRCRRVLVLGADNVTGEHLLEWVGAGFLALGAAATDNRVDEAALPFDRRRHGTILGMGACALVVESEDSVRERGMRGIVELLSSETNNSAYHGSRLDVNHINMIMENLMTAAERRFGINRYAMAAQTVFMSHETYTPARGGSASAEVIALRNTFGEAANDIVVANTKGFTGHPMGVGVEDVIAVKILEYGIVPPVPNFKEVDPDLGVLNLSRGGRYPVQYALHLAAGFGSQISLTLTRRIPGGLDRVDDQARYQHWLDQVSGYDRAETEVVKRTLRVKSDAAPPHSPSPSTWRYGVGPSVRSTAPGDGTGAAYRPMPMAEVSEMLRHTPAPAAQPASKVETPPRPKPAEPAPVVTPTPKPEPVVPAPAPVAPAPEPVKPAPVPVTPAAPAIDPVVSSVLSIVADKTGYPEDMLDLDLDLEADLGIDTVKQAETFAAVQEAFGIPQQEGLSLRDYPTLESVIGFVRTQRPDLAEGNRSSVIGERTPEQPSAPITEYRSPDLGTGESGSLITDQPTGDAVTATVLGIVAEKTGYPEDMLELDLDLEADLGIDTVKQAETLAAIREVYNIPLQENLSLRDYPTLESVIGFVYEMRPDLAEGNRSSVIGDQTPAQPSAPITEYRPPITSVTTIGTLEDADKMPRRVPTPSLRPGLEFCKPTGVTLNGASRVVVMMDRGGVGRSLVNRLEKLDVSVLVVEPGVETDVLDQLLAGYQAEGPVQGVYWLTALDVEPGIEEMDLAGWREENRVRVKNLYTAMRALYDSVAGPGKFLVSATRLGGLHGYGDDGATAPLGGAVTGFTKAYNVEQGMRPEGQGVLVKAVDFEPGRKTAEPADLLIAETLTDPGIVEVGYHKGLRYTVTLLEKPAKDGQPGMVLDKDTVFVVTGAAGGITSAITTDLAVNSGGVFYLLDLVPCPARDDEDVLLFRQDREALKRKLIDDARARGEKPTPVVIDKQIMGIERSEAALRAVEAVEAAGGTAHYHAVNLMEGDAVAAVVEDIRTRYGKIDVLLHAGGLLIDRTLPNKEPNQFNLVFDVKADGFFSLINAAKGMPIGATVSFSSVAGRFGNNGQSDYSSANDLLCKISSSMRSWRPGTRGIAIDWTAWGEIGMASRGSVQQILEALGIDMLPPEAGVPTIRRELTYGGTRGEVLVAGRLGAWMEESDPSGGLDADKLNAALAARQPKLLMVGDVKAARLYGGLEVETPLDPAEQPFLFDHAPDEGTPWLPGVMATESLAELATVLAPGYRVAAVENEQMSGAFKFFRMEPRTLYLNATLTPDGNDLVAHTTLRSVTVPKREGLPPQIKEHFSANIRLISAPVDSPTVEFTPPALDSLDIPAKEVYKSFFHGPAYQVIHSARVDSNGVVAVFSDSLPPNTAPAEVESLMAPRLLELCFQAAALWHEKVKGAMGFPLGFSRVTAYRQEGEIQGRLICVCQTADDGETFDCVVADESGNVFMELAGYLTVSRPA
ncbi:MAG: SDR family NAD(P)-dependent oxidoreductase [Anaerolineales bacterium]|nr:SDR family NAD(P)-dependent oxidoreductase [Anaerolineales bacterium]